MSARVHRQATVWRAALARVVLLANYCVERGARARV